MTERNIDTETRCKLAELLQDYVDGKLTITDVLMNEIKQSHDPSIREIVRTLNRYAPLQYSAENEVRAAWFERVMAFLKSDLEYKWNSHVRRTLTHFVTAVFFLVTIPIGFVLVLFKLFDCSLAIRQALGWPGTTSYDSVFGVILALVCVGLFMGLFCLINRVVDRFRKSDMNYWPFYNREQYEQGMEQIKE